MPLKLTITPPKSILEPPKLTPPQLQQKSILTMPILMPTTAFSSISSDYDSDTISTSNATIRSKSSSQRCSSIYLCHLCRKSQAIYKNNNNNLLYDIVNPMQSPSQMEGHVIATMGRHGRGLSQAWSLFLAFCEVVLVLVLDGIFIVNLLPFIESMFRIYLTSRSYGKEIGLRLHLIADELKSGIESWMTYLVDVIGQS